MTDIEQEFIKDPSKAGDKSVKQIVSIFADGKLTDKGETAPAFREFLNNAEIEQLERYTNEMVTEATDGKILQDIVNTVGRKIGFEVEHGLYQGNAKAIGFDGYWSLDDINLIVECKTTDAYRISTDVLLGYAKRLKDERNLPKEPPILLVVARIDTGDIEAQIRGSRADDRISVIGVESLLSLAKAASELSDGPATENLRKILLPKDYTRLDGLAALITNVINEAQQTSQDQSEINQTASATEADIGSRRSTDVLKSKIIHSLSHELGDLEQASSRSKAQFATQKGEVFFVLTSKRYATSYQQFWFAIRDTWKPIWEEKGGGLVLGLEGKQHFYLINYKKVLEWTASLHATIDPNRGHHWHVTLKESDDKIELILKKSKSNQDLVEYKKDLIV